MAATTVCSNVGETAPSSVEPTAAKMALSLAEQRVITMPGLMVGSTAAKTVGEAALKLG